MKKISELTKQELKELIMSSSSYSSIYRKLGYTKVNNHTTLKSYMKQYGIDTSLLGISIENKRREITMNNTDVKKDKNIYEILVSVSKDWKNVSDDTQFLISNLIAGEKQTLESKLLSNKEIIDLGKMIINSNKDKVRICIDDEVNIINYETIHELFREQFQIMCDNYYLYEANKCKIFQILTEIIDSIIPKKILPSLATWFEIKGFKQGDRIDFKIEQKEEIKKYVSRAGLSGNYNLFRLDNNILDIYATFYGGHCEINLELFINGYVDFNEIIEIILEELILSIKKEAHYALYTFGRRVSDNRITGYGSEDWVSKILSLIEKIDQEKGARILTGNKLMAGAILAEFNESPKKFQKHEVIILPPYNNDEKNINNRFVYVMPKGIDKMLLLGLEGSTIIMDRRKRDASIEFELYKKIGVACVGNPLEIGVFEDTSIS